MRFKILLPLLLVACSNQPPASDDPAAIVVDERDANPAALIAPAVLDTTGPRMHVVEDVSAQGNVVTLRFRPGWEMYDSIQATSSAGTLTRSGLSWRLNSTAPGLVNVKVCQTLKDQLGRVKTACPLYSIWVQIGNPHETVIPASLDATGQTDVCAANDNKLEKWLATIPNGSIIRGADGARYRCDYGVTLVNRWNLAFIGRVTLFTDYDATQQTDSGRKGFRLLEFDQGGNISIDGWSFRGSRPARSEDYVEAKETQHGLEFDGTNGVTLRNITVRQVWGDFVDLSFFNTGRKYGEGLFASEPTRHVEISGSTFSGSGRQGIAITGLYDARIHDNTFDDVQRSMWDFEPGGRWEWVQDVDIFANRVVGRVRNNLVAGHGAGIWVQNITIRDNDFGQKGFRMSFGGGQYRRGLHILRNVAHVELGSTSSPIEISGINDVEIVGNVIPMEKRRQKPAILLQNQIGYRIEGDTAPGARVMWRWEADKRDPAAEVIEDGVHVGGTR